MMEAAHEALIDQWTRLRSWIADARGDIRLQRRLEAAAELWSDPERGFEERNLSSTVQRALASLKPEFRVVVILADLRD